MLTLCAIVSCFASVTTGVMYCARSIKIILQYLVIANV